MNTVEAGPRPAGRGFLFRLTPCYSYGMDDKEFQEAVRRIVFAPRTTLTKVKREIAKILPKKEAQIIQTGPGDPTKRILEKWRKENEKK